MSLSLAIRAGFRGSCPDQDKSKSSIRTSFENRLSGHLPCADRESPYFVQCWVKDVVVTCPLLDAYRRRRQTTEVEVVGVVAVNITYVEQFLPLNARSVSDFLIHTMRRFDIFICTFDWVFETLSPSCLPPLSLSLSVSHTHTHTHSLVTSFPFSKMNYIIYVYKSFQT